MSTYMKNFPRNSWTCPHCQRDTTTSGDDPVFYNQVNHGNLDGNLTILTTFIVCPNSDCKKYELVVRLYTNKGNNLYHGNHTLDKPLNQWPLIPQSNAKIFPDYIPQAITDDYNEACLIKNLSPKASATLSRRCLQGMIWNFWNIKKDNLYEEIQALKDELKENTWEAIDSIRTIGNIGAHMQKDINLIIDVEPEEADALLELIEMLVEEWYINREETKKRTSKIKEIAIKKTKQRKEGKVKE